MRSPRAYHPKDRSATSCRRTRTPTTASTTGPHESNWLITVPLVILAVGALIAGFLQAPAFKIEKFKDWVEPAGVTVLYDQAARSKPARSPT